MTACELCAKAIPLDSTKREHRTRPAHGETFVGLCTNIENRDQAIRMLRDAYKHILAMRADELPAYVWAQTLGTLHLAKEQLLAEGSKAPR